MTDERRNAQRRKFNYYMRVLENSSLQLVGYLSDISPQGFQLECPRQIITNRDYSFRLELTPDLADKSFITLSARCRWTRPDEVDPTLNDAGFQIMGIFPYDNEIFQRMVMRYAA